MSRTPTPPRSGRHDAVVRIPDPDPVDVPDRPNNRAADAEAGPQSPPGAGIRAEGLGLRTRSGWVFRDVSFAVPPSVVATIVGPVRSGRSALLLAVSGHMRPTEGRAFIGGIDVVDDPAGARRAVGLGLFEGLNDLERDLTVADHVRQELSLHPEAGGGVAADAALETVGLDVDPRTPVDELAPLERTLLGVALALVGSPAAIVVDDVDRDLGASERPILWHALKRIASRGTTVLTACIDHEAAHATDLVLDLESISSREG